MADENYQYLLTEMDKISKLHEQEWKKSGKYFNVFSALGVEKKEIRHSALLATFLNPNDFHGMSDIFLKEFMNRIDFNKFPTRDALVFTEEVISNNRRLDIDICSNDGKYKVVIENKIYTVDHDKQVSAYFDDLKKQNLIDYKLVYLTLDGEEPTEEISEEDKKHLTCLSYKEDIINMLDSVASIKNMLPQPVLEVIRQYCLTLKNLTNQGVDKIMNDEISMLLLKGDNLKLAEEMYKQIEYIKKQTLTSFLTLLKEAFENKGRKVEISDNNPENAAHKYISTKNTWISLKVSISEKIKFFIRFEPEYDEFWCQFSEFENSEEYTTKFKNTTGTGFKSLYIQFKNPNDGFKEFARMDDDKKKEYISNFVDDIEARLEEMKL